ncbi:MAG: ATP-binding protein [Candidatus Kapaibacterium sp.]
MNQDKKLSLLIKSFEHSGISLYATDQNGEIIYINTDGPEVGDGEIKIGDSIFDSLGYLMPFGDFDDLMATLLQAGKWNGTSSLKETKEKVYQIKVRLESIDKAQYLIFLVSDITHHYKAARMTDRLSIRMQQAMDAANLAWWEWFLPTNVVEFDPRKAWLLGYQPEELDSNVYAFTEMIHPDDYDHAMQAMRNHLEGRDVCYQVEYRIRTKTGGYKWLYDRGEITEYGPDGSPRRLIGVVFDITDRIIAEQSLKESESRLKELNYTKDKFFSIIAHDLKNPFNTLVTMSEYLLENYDMMSKDDQLREIRDLKKAADNAYKLIENLLSWSRAQTGKINFTPDDHDLYELITNNLFLFKEAAANKNITIENNIKQNTFAYFDYQMIHTVLRNLISNSVKFSKPGGKIILSETIKGGMREISVTDTGIGIATDDIRKLFRIDENISRQGTMQESGTGLGLIISKEFIDAHGGDITVDSVPEEGSTFRFTIPAHHPDSSRG